MIHSSTSHDHRKPRIVFIGHQTNGKSCLTLKRLITAEYNIVLVISNKKPEGEKDYLKSILRPWTSIKKQCARNQIPYVAVDPWATDKQVRNANRRLLSARNVIEKARPDYLVCSTWHWLIHKDIIQLAGSCAVNCHSSLLPKYPGLCPTRAPLINCDKETGATLHLMTPKADLGDIILQKAFPLRWFDTPATVYLKIVRVAPLIIDNGLRSLIANTVKPIPQSQKAKIYRRLDCSHFWRKYLQNRVRVLFGKEPRRI